MKRSDPWSEEHPQKRRRLPPADLNVDITLAPSPSTFKRHSHTQKEQCTPKTHHNRLPNPKASWIIDWIPQPPTGCVNDSISNELDDIGVRRVDDFMATPSVPRKRSRLGSMADSVNASDNTRSPYYSDPGYPTQLEDHGCYMRKSKAGPDSNDIAFSQHLLQHKAQQIPSDTMFEDLDNFYNMLSGRSETYILCFLHFLLMPGAEPFFFRGQSHLEHVVDGLNDSWTIAEQIHGPTPQPDHSRCLKKSAFDEEQRRKLRSIPAETFSYAVRDNQYFPYLTCEIKSSMRGLDIADRQNMHSMSIVLRSLVQLAEAAGAPEKVHRRILGYSISHDLNYVQIYGYYPELEEGVKTKYYRYPVAHFHIWSEENKWKCYSFVEKLDIDFVPRHIALVKELLAGVKSPEPFKVPQPVGPSNGQRTPPASGQQGSSYSENSNNLHIESTMKEMHEEIIQKLEERENSLKEELEGSRQETREIKQEAREFRQEAKEREETLRREAKEREDSLRQEAKQREDNNQKLVQSLTDQLHQLYQLLSRKDSERT